MIPNWKNTVLFVNARQRLEKGIHYMRHALSVKKVI